MSASYLTHCDGLLLFTEATGSHMAATTAAWTTDPGEYWGPGWLTAYLQSGHGLLLSSRKATQTTQTALDALLICTSPSAARDEAEETVTTAW